MITQDILKADVLDIVFDNRNKAYGAYILRKYYDKRLANSLGIMLLIVAVVCLLSFRFGKRPSETIGKENGDIILSDIYLKPDEPKKPEPKPMEQKHAAPQKKFDTQKSTPIKIEPDNKVTDENKVPDQSVLDIKAVAIETVSGEPGGKDVVISKNVSDPGDGNELIKDEAAVDINDPMEVADTPPSYPGGIEALQNFLRRNLRTPDELESGQSASVKIKFVVSHDGEMYGYEVIKSAGNAFDNEVVRVLKKMPKWNPGRYKGQSVSVYYVIPVKFESIEE